jgi:hypothetical protein
MGSDSHHGSRGQGFHMVGLEVESPVEITPRQFPLAALGMQSCTLKDVRGVIMRQVACPVPVREGFV